MTVAAYTALTVAVVILAYFTARLVLELRAEAKRERQYAAAWRERHSSRQP